MPRAAKQAKAVKKQVRSTKLSKESFKGAYVRVWLVPYGMSVSISIEASGRESDFSETRDFASNNTGELVSGLMAGLSKKDWRGCQIILDQIKKEERQ